MVSNPVPIEFMIITGFAAAATLLVTVIAVALVIRKALDLRRTRRRKRLYAGYSALFAKLIVHEVDVGIRTDKAGAMIHAYESLIAPVKKQLNQLRGSQRKAHRETLRQVLIDYAQDLAGEALDRLVYFFSSFGFVEDQLRLLRSRHWWIRAEAARDLGLLRARKGIAPLTKALNDPHADVRTVAMQSLIVLAGIEALQSIFRSSRGLTKWMEIELSVVILGFNENAIPYLIEALGVKNKTVVSFAIEMLAQIGFVEAVDPLLQVVRHYPDPRIRAKAAEALGRLADERAEAVLLELTDHPHPELRLRAIEALGRVGTPSALPFLQKGLESSSDEEKEVIVRAIGGCGAAGHSLLSKLLCSENALVAGLAGQVLEEAGSFTESS